jgi:hypothetical protein
MISSYLQGGLGNQLFQIAAALAVGIDNNTPSVFDVENHHLPNQGRKCQNYLETIFRNLQFTSSLPIKHLYQEPHFHYIPIEYVPDMCLVGYFQSEKYFEKNGDIIRELFAIDEKTKASIDEKYGVLLKNETVAVHVRRGDYLKYNHMHPPCTLDYYKQAMDNFSKDTTYLFFSDDIDWCKENFIHENYIFIEGNEDILDFYLISECKNAILSNSSFSWWGVWLNERGKNLIIAPKKWFGPESTHDTKDLIPARWKVI